LTQTKISFLLFVAHPVLRLMAFFQDNLGKLASVW